MVYMYILLTVLQAGFTCGVALLLAMGALMLYTSYRVLHSVRGISKLSFISYI